MFRSSGKLVKSKQVRITADLNKIERGVGNSFSPGDLFTQVEIRSIVNRYVTTKGVLKPDDQAYVNVTEDPILLDALSDLKAGERRQLQEAGFLRRNEVIERIVGNMQPWHEINGEGKEPVVR